MKLKVSGETGAIHTFAIQQGNERCNVVSPKGDVLSLYYRNIFEFLDAVKLN